MKKIPLSQGRFALVDDEDFERLNQYNWYASYNQPEGNLYVKRNLKKENGEKTSVLMHREILSPSASEQIDHINHNSLDNQKKNLRICSGEENLRNAVKKAPATSQNKGVYWHKRDKKWCARVKIPNGKQSWIGSYISEIEAAKAYDKSARELFGEFAHCNFGEKI